MWPMALRLHICDLDRHRPCEADRLVVHLQQRRAFMRQPLDKATARVSRSGEMNAIQPWLQTLAVGPRYVDSANASSVLLRMRNRGRRRCPIVMVGASVSGW